VSSVNLQDAEALRVQDEAILQTPEVQAPDQAPANFSVDPMPSTTPGLRRQSTRSTRGVAPQRLTYEVRGEPSAAYYLTESFHNMIAGLVASVDQREHMQREFLAMMSSTDGTIENWPRSLREYPQVFKAGSKKDPNSPTLVEAMNGKYCEEYWEAMGVEMQALPRATTWKVVPRTQAPSDTNVLPLTWVFKLKHYPDGRPRKFKARLCIRGDKQVEGTNYTDKYHL